jgi:hypothetical protein
MVAKSQGDLKYNMMAMERMGNVEDEQWWWISFGGVVMQSENGGPLRGGWSLEIYRGLHKCCCV